MNVRVGVAALSAFCCIATACAKHDDESSATATMTPRPQVTAVAVGRYGIGCRTYAQPGTVGPPSYLVSDRGKFQVPPLEPRDAATLQRVQQYVHSKTLRFAYLSGRFVLFDPNDNPCADTDVEILNAWNEFYEPGEAPGFTGSMPPGNTPKRPWLTPSPPQQ